MKISGDRLLAELKDLREMTDTPGQGVSRFSYGEKDMEARKYLASKAKEAGLSYRTDAVGNVYIWDPDREATGAVSMAESSTTGTASTAESSTIGTASTVDKIMIGSHMDSVKNGGWLDGIYGTLSAFEALRTLKENDALKENIQLVIFAEEEGSNFTSTTTGSKFVTGVYGAEDLERLKDQRGISMAEMIKPCGFPPYVEKEVLWDYSKIKAMLELHIEQGPVLDESGGSIGIVEKVNGMEVMEFTLEGLGNHAGASPMSYRKDALVAAALAIIKVEEIAKADKSDRTVATVGRINVEPGCSNVIPEKVVFTVEVRHVDQATIRDSMEKIRSSIEEIAKVKGISCSHKKLAESLPVAFDENLIKTIEKAAEASGQNYRRMNSGAVHDASMVGIHVPAAMIFVPSIKGRSHVAAEDTKEEDLLKGAQLLLDTLLILQS